MKRIFAVILFVLPVSTIAQTRSELCPCDTLLNKQIKEMYQFLDELDPHLSKFIAIFAEHKGDTISLNAMKKIANTIEINMADIDARFKKNNNCFWCSVNKELGDYKAALSIMIEKLKTTKVEIEKTEISNFHIDKIISSYQYIITSRSALMAIMDSTHRNCILQSNLSKTEKRLKRMSIANIILTAIVGILVITTSN